MGGWVGAQGRTPREGWAELLTHGVADPAGAAAALQLSQHAALKGQGRHSEEEIPHVLPCPNGKRPPECPLTWLTLGSASPHPDGTHQ